MMEKINHLALIGGCSCAGKTTFSKRIQQKLENNFSTHIEMDLLYKPEFMNLKPEDLANYDSPDAFDWDMIRGLLTALLGNRPYTLPTYLHPEWYANNRNPNIQPAKIILFDGILALHDEKIRSAASYKIYVETGLDLCLQRRYERDLEWNRSRKFTDEHWSRCVLPFFYRFVLPTKCHAGIVVDGSGDTCIYEVKVLEDLRNLAGDRN